ncbi:MAG: DUF4402 domain-containing protein [Salinisphaeraceae bacterium]|nr:DUF4402 domain-containing protein [Salinisphaeraceae bacterium]
MTMLILFMQSVFTLGLADAAEPFTGFAGLQEQRKIQIDFLQTLNFGRLAASGQPGIVVLDAASGIVQTHGVTRLPGNESIGQLVLRGEPNAAFQIWLPEQLAFSGAGDPLIARNLTAYPDTFGRFDPTGSAELTLGGLLEIPPSPIGGKYKADFTITAEYR